MNPWPYPSLFAHRGGGTLAPENTLAGLRKAVEMGYRAVEFDVMLTADDEPVLMHDPCFGRTIQARGNVAETPWAKLKSMDAGQWHSAEFKSEPVPHLSSMIDACCEAGIAMNVEIKPSPGRERVTGKVVAEALVRAQTRHSILKRSHLIPLVSSFSITALESFTAHWTQARHQIRTGLLMDRMPSDWFQEATRLGCEAIHCNYRLLNAAIVRTIRERGFWLFCYTVNEPEIGAELLSWGVNGFCTDRLDLFQP